jgi:hypothetical protein
MIKRFFEVLFKKEYTSVDERLHDAKYLTRINIVIITISVIIILFNLSRIVWLLLGYR